MIRINLLPFRAARKKENIRRQISILSLALVLVFILLAYKYYDLNKQTNEISSKVENKKTEIAKYTKINKELAEIKKKLKILNERMKIIKGLETKRFEPVRLMDSMTSLIVPKRMWIVTFSSNGNNVNISGVAVDNQTVADFMTRLEKSKLFRTVNLKKTKKSTSKGKLSSFKNFEISCVKNPPKKIEDIGEKKKK